MSDPGDEGFDKIPMESNDGHLLVPKPRLVELVASNEWAIHPIVPRNLEEAMQYADFVIAAGLAPDSYDKSPQKIAIGIMAGLELRVPPVTALRNIMIVNNRYCVWGDLAVALAQRDGLLVKMEHSLENENGIYNQGEPLPINFPDDFACCVRLWRRGQDAPYVGRFSVRDARRAHLWANTRKAPWMQYPVRMLFNRARAFALRDGFADCLGGLSIREEIEDLPTEPKQVERGRLDELLGPVDSPQTEDSGQAAGSEPPAQEELL